MYFVDFGCVFGGMEFEFLMKGIKNLKMAMRVGAQGYERNLM